MTTAPKLLARKPSARKPGIALPDRIAPLATLPVFHKLHGRRVVLAGATEGARWKAELLAAAGANVVVLAGEDADIAPFAALAESLAGRQDEGFGQLAITPRPWRPSDLEGAALAIADLDDPRDIEGFVAAARHAGVPVNIIDNPAFCDFQFGAIVNRSPLVIAISTDGAAPVFGQAIRAKIEALLPRGLAAWAKAARDWRPLVQAKRPDYALRRRFWERFTSRALAAPDRAPEEADRDALMQAFAGDANQPATGQVTFVGAGPGDPDLLTLKAVRALQAADIILFDDLVSAEVLELARREAQRMIVGKTGHGPSCKQGEINDVMVRLARQGKRVVRLKGGDPLVFGRASEELAACRAASIAVEIIPGITAAQGVAAALGISLTERKVARRVQFLTGHGEDGKLPADINWAAIADPGATTVLYMPRGTLAAFVARAIAAGLPGATPATAITYATRPNQREITARLDALPARVVETAPGPTLVLIGAVLRERLAAAQAATTDRVAQCA
ncbi:MAG: uroporphyrin-III C-methyltransferase / precorrin-2 dehydrogenase / sirohydrochlorin [Beijerinckiaceae bacterium]|nr:MAG: uroporphyrin-III C-methyltransferase / precorrin-2 dehydrogenase / sirohydrochlorin [Beijerinckiaceae bacterium]